MKLLLHTCCAPCSVYCIDSLRKEEIEPTIYWYNPNIHPYMEYKARRDCLKEYTNQIQVNAIFEEDYGLDEFCKNVIGDLQNRCSNYCYKVRLEQTAKYAKENGYDAISTTLLVSPYQKHDVLKEMGEKIAKEYGLTFLYRDFRVGFREGQAKARELGLYMQKYCGCIFSEEDRYFKQIQKDKNNYIGEKTYEKIIIFIILIFIGILLTYLFYNQATDNFESDLLIQMSDNASEYSATKIIYSFINKYLGGKIGISIFLSLVSITSIILTKEILKEYNESLSEFLQWIYAILLNFCIAIYFPLVHKMLYLGTQTGNVWHNSTYICMKPLGLLAIILYLKLQKKYLQKIDIKYYILFCLTLILVNAVKPSFIVTFAPAMLIYLIIDFFKNIKDRSKVRNIIIFGFAVLISLPILIYQNSVLFGTTSENKITIGCMSILKLYHKYPLISLIQSAAFPLFILITNWKTIIKDRKYSFILTMNIFGLAEYLFLQETGTRFSHANFSWQYYFTLALAFIFSVIIMNNRKKEEKDDNKIYYIICYILLGLHILSGIIYFTRLLMGYKYF